jgi:hypothetical protein
MQGRVATRCANIGHAEHDAARERDERGLALAASRGGGHERTTDRGREPADRSHEPEVVRLSRHSEHESVALDYLERVLEVEVASATEPFGVASDVRAARSG